MLVNYMKPFFDLHEIDFVEYGRINAELHMWQMFWEKKTNNEYYEINQLAMLTIHRNFEPREMKLLNILDSEDQ